MTEHNIKINAMNAARREIGAALMRLETASKTLEDAGRSNRMIDVKQLRETANAFAGWGADLDMRPSEILELLDRLETAERRLQDITEAHNEVYWNQDDRYAAMDYAVNGG